MEIDICNYIFQNTIFVILLILFIYFILGFKFRREDFNFGEDKSFVEWLIDREGWHFALGCLIITIIYFFIKRGVISDILSVFGIKIC